MSRNFRAPKEAEQEEIWLKNTVPRNTKYTTKWSVRIFEEWQATRGNKIAKQETLGFTCSNIESIQDLSENLIEMSACTLNFWLTKFVGEVVNRNGGRYPPKSLYVIVCGINRHLQEINTENAVNILNKNDQRFFMFRKALDAEMKESTKLGVTQKTQKDPRENITEEEEMTLWKKHLLGKDSAESLLHTMYYYNGKLFGLRANEL